MNGVQLDDQTYQVLDNLDEEAFTALKEDIRERGVLVPLEVDEQGRVLDGHQRARAILQLQKEGLRVDYRVQVRPGLDEHDKFGHSISINLQRRQLSLEQKRDLSVVLRRRFSWSYPRLGAVLGVAHTTVMRWCANLEEMPVETMGTDGRVYRASQWGGVSAGSRDAAAALQAAAAVGPTRATVDIRRALVLARHKRLENAPLEEVKGAVDPELVECELRLGPFTEALSDVPDASVDLVLTDPPYPKEYLPLWWELSETAARILKPGRLLVAYCGQRWLDQCFNALQSHLDYAWMGGLFFGNQTISVHDRRVFSGFRCILMFSKGEWEPLRWHSDAWADSSGPEKDLHPWQQSLATFQTLVEAHSRRGELVIDPCLGSGTTGVAALQVGRRFLGCDVDERAVATARRRMWPRVDIFASEGE